MIDYANFSKQSRVKHLKMRIQIHAKLVANAQIHTHPRHTATHIFAFFFDLSICDLNFSKNTHTNTTTHTCIHTRARWNVMGPADGYPSLFSRLFQLVIDNIMRGACIIQ